VGRAALHVAGVTSFFGRVKVLADIHATAIVHPSSELDESVVVGPYCMIGPRCAVGAGTRLDAFVYLKRDVTLGRNNALHAGCVLGDDPQHLAFKDNDARVVIGSDNTFREGFTAHKPMNPEGTTSIGDRCFFMACSHVAHDCHVGNAVIVANGSALGGHVIVEDQANISGLVGLHQHLRVGRLAMLGGVSRMTADVPPFCMAVCDSLKGLNAVGMKRAGITQKSRSQVKILFKTIFTEGRALTTGVEFARTLITEWGDHACPEARHFVDFIENRRQRPMMRYSSSGSDVES
jgi:UDP-N-acetylglucosamine acyltransferase